MKKETLARAMELEKDIQQMEFALSYYKQGQWSHWGINDRASSFHFEFCKNWSHNSEVQDLPTWLNKPLMEVVERELERCKHELETLGSEQEGNSDKTKNELHETMKIEIDYNGAFAVCRIEPMEEPGKMVNFNEADTKSQTYALSAFRCIKKHWRREKLFEKYKQCPAMKIKQEFQVTMQNFDKIGKLLKEGIVLNWSFDTSSDPMISVTLKDGHTIVETDGWLMQDTEGKWLGVDNGYHRMLKQYNKIIKEL